ncbi:MAG: DsrE family protein [Anaerolineaceae bacterium]|nr:DsrE family protein [Anaerolineaceae bacterium]
MTTHQNFNETAILVTRDGMGSSDLSLQHKLIKTYFKLLIENETLPSVICFYTEGVKLVVKGSPILEELAQMEEKGVRLVICMTCLKHYEMEEDVEVGIIGGMGDMIEAQLRAQKVITL